MLLKKQWHLVDLTGCCEGIKFRQPLELINSLPTDLSGQRLADALRLLVELGLRQVELLHLDVRLDPISREPHWWCSYEKWSGGGRTAPRRVHALPLRDLDGQVLHWNLMTRRQAQLVVLPPRGSACAGESFNTCLNRQKGWKSLKAQLAGQVAKAGSLQLPA
jgi:hypothetical protein